MSDATTSRNMSPELTKVAERAKRNPSSRLLALAHLIDEPALVRAYSGLRKEAAAGVDGIFIETHPDPAKARSDRESQWPLSQLRVLLSSFVKVRQSLADESLVGARPA